jgi:hypothetical protein
MTGLKLLLTIISLCILCQSCGINNNIKVKNLREEIVSEQRKTQGLMKKRNAELKRLQIVKDSVTRYHELLNITHP